MLTPLVRVFAFEIMRKVKFSDEQIVKKWEKYCKRNGLRYVVPTLPLNRNADWCVKLEDERGWLAVYSQRPDGFFINESLMKTTEERIEEIVYLLEEARDKLQDLLFDIPDESELSLSASSVIDEIESIRMNLVC